MSELKPDFDKEARECLVASNGVNQQMVFTHGEEPELVPEGVYAVVRVEFVRFDDVALPEWMTAEIDAEPVVAGVG